MTIVRYALLPFALAAFSVACDPSDTEDDNIGSVQLAVGSGETYDVARFQFEIHPVGASCGDAGALFSPTVDLDPGTLPAWMAQFEGHAFASELFVLPPGDYLVCASPLQTDNSASAACTPVSDTATVTAGGTAEVVLVSPCDGDGNGAIDVVAALGDPLTIDDIDIAPSKFLTTCDTATLTAAATDSGGNPVTSFDWAITSEPAGAMSTLSAMGNPATFTSTTPGDYMIEVTANDPSVPGVSLTFPLFVSDDPCP